MVAVHVMRDVEQIGSALCGAAQSMTWLILARALQGIGGGGIFQMVMVRHTAQRVSFWTRRADHHQRHRLAREPSQVRRRDGRDLVRASLLNASLG